MIKMKIINLTEKQKNNISKEFIICELQNLPKDKSINKKQLYKYYKEGILSFWPGIISSRFGTIKEACKIAGIKCNALYGKEKMKYMAQLNIIWNKEKVIKAVKSVESQFNNIKEYEELSKNNKNLPHRQTIKKYLKTKTIHDAFKNIGIKYKNYYWSNERIINTLQKLYQENGPLSKTQINKFRLKRKSCGIKLIRDRFGSLEKFALYSNIKFCPADMKGNGAGIFTRIGKNENKILSMIEEENNINIIRQYYVAGKFVDGYDKKNNVVYEIDEPNHKYQMFEDIKRENLIKNVLNCNFIRIKDRW